MSDAQGKLKSLKKKVKDDVEKLEKKIRALASKVTSAASLGPAVVVDVLQMPAASMACLCSYFFTIFERLGTRMKKMMRKSRVIT
jgi:hypothetical protein